MSTEQVSMEPVITPEPETMGSSGGPTSAGTDSAPKASDPNLADELREFGKQIENLFTTVRNSPRGKDIEQQLTSAWRDMERGVNSKIGAAPTTNLKDSVSGTAQKSSEEVQTGLARGLRSLNQWMNGKTQELDERYKKHEEAVSKAATNGTADDEITDRFGKDEPVFGQGETVPATPVTVTSLPNAGDDPESIITERFSDNPPTL